MALCVRRYRPRLGFEMSALVGAIGLITLITGCTNQSGSPVAAQAPLPPPRIKIGQVACLETEWYPGGDPFAVENRLARELVRQGVLLAAREELGLATRDEILGEPFPDSPADTGPIDESGVNAVEPLSVSFELDGDGSWEARLYGAGAESENPVWRHEARVDFEPDKIYAQIAAQMAKACTTIADQLRRAGASGEAATANPHNELPPEVDKQLAEMNFVSQYAAVRMAHRAIAEKGPSLPWLGVLVRGYAHLALLTEHTWSSHHEAFAARSLLYAERMLLLDGESTTAEWHRAYARALVGMHGAAIDQLETIAKQNDTAPANGPKIGPPEWSHVIEPFVKFEHDKLTQVVKNYPRLDEIVTLLQWHLYRSYMHERWIYEKGLETIEACPEAYGVYSVMANCRSMVIQRSGIARGMAAFGKWLPDRVTMLADLPASARALTDAEIETEPTHDGTLSDQPIKIAQALMGAAQQEAITGECTWAILASLIAEEQFVEAADLLRVSGNAVEHSRKPIVTQLFPLVEGHRYAPYIRSYSLSPNEAHKVAEVLGELTVIDPRPRMQRLFVKAWRMPMADGRTGYNLSLRAVSGHNFTHADLLSSWYGVAADWTAEINSEARRKFASEFRSVSPYSPNAVRLQWETAEAVDMEQLVKWERELHNDPVGWMTIAKAFYGLGYVEAAAQRYQRSLDISPSYEATEGLAYCHYYSGKKDLWRSTLEAYLEEEDLSLSHARIHLRIAEELITERKWTEAERHALAAAQTYSSWGLQLASRVYEGMQEWRKSEHSIAEATRNYPSYSTGTDWYFWCRRTGRGDREAARSFAERNIQIAANSTYRGDADRVFVYCLLEGDPKTVLLQYEGHLAMCPDSEETWDKAWRLLHAIVVASESDDAAGKELALRELRALAKGDVQKSDPDWVTVLDGLCRAFEGEELSENFLKAYYETICKGAQSARSNYCYFMGVALDHHGRTELAELFWRRAAFGGPFDSYNATLAGDRLVKRYGPERGGLPEEFAEQEAKAAATHGRETEDNTAAESDPSI